MLSQVRKRLLSAELELNSATLRAFNFFGVASRLQHRSGVGSGGCHGARNAITAIQNTSSTSNLLSRLPLNLI
jgi:hypothetical protein